MFCPNCKTEYREGFVECSDCNIELVTDIPVDDETDDNVEEKRPIKKKPFIGFITLFVSLPVIIWLLVLLTSDQKYYPDTIGGVLLFFQALGILCAFLLFVGRISGHYLAIFTWVFFFCYGIFHIYYSHSGSPIMTEKSTSPYSLLLLVLGLPILCLLFKELTKSKSKI